MEILFHAFVIKIRITFQAELIIAGDLWVHFIWCFYLLNYKHLRKWKKLLEMRKQFLSKAGLKKMFVCRHPTDQLWRCRLEIFYWTSKSNFFCFVFWVKKTFPGVTHYLNIKFYFSNACLNSAETHILFPSTKIRSKDAWFQVSILFVFFLNPLSKQYGMYLKVFKFRGY